MGGFAVPRGRGLTRLLGVSALGVAAAMLAAPRLSLRLLGVDPSGQGVPLLAGLYGGRDLALGLALLRAAADERPDPRWLDAVALSQASDMALAAALRRRGLLGRRAVGMIHASAAATFAAALLARRDVSRL